jgi:ketosteroid isomerase-like protein
MSQENVEVVRRHLDPYEGEDFVPVLREAVDRLGPESEPDAVLALWAGDPSFRHLRQDVVWEIAVGGPLDVKATGPTEILGWWAEWLEVWESYVYRAVEYRDLGDWILTPVEVRATGRSGIPVEMRTSEIRRVQDGKNRRLQCLWNRTTSPRSRRAAGVIARTRAPISRVHGLPAMDT